MRAFLPKNKATEGQTLISLLIALVIFGILASAIFSLTASSFQFVSFSRARIAARHLAQEKIELIRNLPYDDVGTIAGVPGGNLAQTENIVRNGLNYEIKTSIVYVDDPFDGIAPTDLLPTDYKRVRIDVSWKGLTGSRADPLVLVTDIAPKGIETTAGGGTLSILVFDANASPVAQADVHIEATEVDPDVILDLQTSDTGYVVLPGTPVCTSCYDITVTKSGYSTDRTYTTSEVANPNKPPASVIEGELTEISFAIDKLSTLNVASVSDRDSGFNPLPNITFQLRGAKTTGIDSDDFPVYKFDKQFATDGSGNLIITDIEWSNYTIIMPSGSGYDIAGTNPLIPLQLLPDTSVNWTFSLATTTTHRLLVTFTDPGQAPVASVSATLSFGAYEETKLSGADTDPDFGQVFFVSLQDKNHDLEATASGYQDVDTKVKVDGYTEEDIVLQPE
ncbi:prepilin-type N-terminal cleavage/methylation domain-containing protein [Patescibacteria group bacterium]|nr:prepilin-type N-terminal cleavage/methylation domain-containing protein [Patescibacteria group bacterium]